MFKIFAIVFAAIMAFAAAEPKPGFFASAPLVSAYSAPYVGAVPAVHAAPALAYSAYAAPAHVVAGAPVAYYG